MIQRETPHRSPIRLRAAPFIRIFQIGADTGKISPSSAPHGRRSRGLESPCFLASISSAMAKPNGAQAASIPGRTDIPLTEEGERKARGLHERLKGLKFDRVFTSPLQRAARTCALAGFGDAAKRRSRPARMELRRLRGAQEQRNPRASGPAGSCSATDARTASSQPTSAPAPIASSAACARRMIRRSCFPAGIS